MVRPKMVYFNLLVILLLKFAVSCSMSEVDILIREGPRSFTVPSLEFYLFEQYVDIPGQNLTNIISSPPDGDVRALAWGNLAISEQPARASMNRTGPLIGNSPAFFYKTTRENNVVILKPITLGTDRYNGTIFTFCDFNRLPELGSEIEFAVTGGTGSFRDSSGYAIVSLAARGSDHNTYLWKVYLSTCKRHPLLFQ